MANEQNNAERDVIALKLGIRLLSRLIEELNWHDDAAIRLTSTEIKIIEPVLDYLEIFLDDHYKGYRHSITIDKDDLIVEGTEIDD